MRGVTIKDLTKSEKITILEEILDADMILFSYDEKKAICLQRMS
jgi:hypothetical protein